MPKPEHVRDDHQQISNRDEDRKRGYERKSLLLLNELLTETICLHATVKKIAIQCDTGRRAAGFGFIIGLPQNKEKESQMPLELKITNEQQIKVTLAPKTDTGKPATLDGSPAWTTISGSSQVVVSEDGLSATLVSSDDPGDTEILVKADADLGEGIEEISDIVKLSVIGATAKNLGMTAGTPEAKPGVVPA